MNNPLGRFRALVPASLAARGGVLIALVVVAIGGPAYAAHRLLARHPELQQAYEMDAFAAAVLAECPQRGSPDGPEWLPDVDARAGRVRWAGVFDRAGQGFELRRRTALPREQILAQVDFSAAAPRSQPLRCGDAASAALDLLTFPQADGQATLAVLLERPATPAVGVRLAGLACLALGGLALAVAWFRVAIQRPIRRVVRTLADVQAGLSRATLEALPPSELTQLVESVETMRQELKHWRVEAAYLRHSVEVQVDARTRQVTQLARRAGHAAETDALTRLGNRRLLERELPRLDALHRQTGVELAVVAIDMDGLKRLNDALGHAMGDTLLAFLGSLLRSITRQGLDVAVRCGGDEFVLLLPGTSAAQACDVVRRLSALFAQRARTVRGVDPPPGLSAGVAALHEHHARTWEDLLSLADEAMYWAKRGRHGVATIREARPHGARV